MDLKSATMNVKFMLGIMKEPFFKMQLHGGKSLVCIGKNIVTVGTKRTVLSVVSVKTILSSKVQFFCRQRIPGVRFHQPIDDPA